MDFVAATNNAHKLAEMRRMLEPMGFKLLSMRQAGVDIEPEETGETFAENARIKAAVVCEAVGLAAVADDSGLVVDALEGAPGVRSARYAGAHGDDTANNHKLLKDLESVPAEKRTARFVSSIALVLPGGASLACEGSCEGVIGTEAKGNGGFGYDPLFYVYGKSFAELGEAEKDAISHRGRALEQFVSELPRFLRENGM